MTDILSTPENFYAQFLFSAPGKAAWAQAYKILKPEAGQDIQQDDAANYLLAEMKKWLDSLSLPEADKIQFWDDNLDGLNENVYSALA